jgi:beta-phosphoglucomutase
MGDGKGVIFDMDGVLVDTGWAHLQAWDDLAEKEGFEHSDAFFYRTFGMPNYRILPMLMPGISEEDIERIGDWKEERYRQIIGEKLTLGDEVRTLLEDLKASGFAMAVGSSAPEENVEMIIKRTGLDAFMDAFVTKADVQHGKPDPETFLKAAGEIGIAAGRCVVVEDAVQGIEAGKAAGMRVVAVTSTRRREDLAGADMIVDSLAELRAEDFGHLLEG